jgi:integrase
MEIPKPLRQRFGKPRFVQSLETESRTLAEQRVWPVVAAWKREIAKAKGEPIDDDAAYWRRRLRYAKDEKDHQSILDQIMYAADDIGAINVDIGDQPSSDPEAQRFHASATGLLVDFTEHLNEWLSTSHATAKTQDMHRSVVNRLAHEIRLVQDITRPEVRRWVTKLMNDDGLAPKTVQRMLSGLRGYWRYLQSIGVAGEADEPFSKLDVARQAKQKFPRSARQPFEPADVVNLLDAAIELGDDNLADLIRLGMWTGCRIEELCALKIEDVKDDYFSVNDAKTKAGWRDVPIHRELAQTMERLIEGSKDGYVLAGLSVNKYGDRSNAVGKRFGKLKTKMGFGTQHVFHSIRKTVVTILENAGVQENVVADIVGHEKTTMTYGLYSGGLSLEVKREALDKLAY